MFEGVLALVIRAKGERTPSYAGFARTPLV
jgi:hypothetical protein